MVLKLDQNHYYLYSSIENGEEIDNISKHNSNFIKQLTFNHVFFILI